MAKLIPTLAFITNLTASIIIATLYMKTLKYQLQPQLYNHTHQQHDTLYTSYVSFYHQLQNYIIEEIRTIARGILHLYSIERIIMLLSVYLFAHFVAKSLLEFIGQYFPKLNYANVVKCLSNIVDSMLLFGLILGFIMMSMFITNYQIDQKILQNPTDINNAQLQSEKYSQKLIFSILEAFLYGRILFSIGYLFGTITKMQSFRATGVGFTLLSIVLALSYTYQFDVFKYF